MDGTPKRWLTSGSGSSTSSGAMDGTPKRWLTSGSGSSTTGAGVVTGAGSGSGSGTAASVGAGALVTSAGGSGAATGAVFLALSRSISARAAASCSSTVSASTGAGCPSGSPRVGAPRLPTRSVSRADSPDLVMDNLMLSSPSAPSPFFTFVVLMRIGFPTHLSSLTGSPRLSSLWSFSTIISLSSAPCSALEPRPELPLLEVWCTTTTPAPVTVRTLSNTLMT